jgi:hypothetical protein
MSSEPISISERRSSRNESNESAADRTPLSPAQQRAYRQLAIFVLRLDVPTLTRDLRARRMLAMPELRLAPPTDCAA